MSSFIRGFMYWIEAHFMRLRKAETSLCNCTVFSECSRAHETPAKIYCIARLCREIWQRSGCKCLVSFCMNHLFMNTLIFTLFFLRPVLIWITHYFFYTNKFISKAKYWPCSSMIKLLKPFFMYRELTTMNSCGWLHFLHRLCLNKVHCIKLNPVAYNLV